MTTPVRSSVPEVMQAITPLLVYVHHLEQAVVDEYSYLPDDLLACRPTWLPTPPIPSYKQHLAPAPAVHCEAL